MAVSSEPQTVEAMEQLMIAREAEMRADMEPRFKLMKEELAGGGPGTPADAAVRKLVARLTEPPPNIPARRSCTLLRWRRGGGWGEPLAGAVRERGDGDRAVPGDGGRGGRHH